MSWHRPANVRTSCIIPLLETKKGETDLEMRREEEEGEVTTRLVRDRSLLNIQVALKCDKSHISLKCESGHTQAGAKLEFLFNRPAFGPVP